MIDVGDVVEIKSGSVGMTVISLNGEVANCLWVVDGVPNQIEVPVLCLKVKCEVFYTFTPRKKEEQVSQTSVPYTTASEKVNGLIDKPVGLFEFATLNKSTQAFHLLCEKVEELNGKDHKFNWSDNSRKWYVYWNMKTNSFRTSVYHYSFSSVSACLCLKSEKLCKQLVEENTELLKDYFAVEL